MDFEGINVSLAGISAEGEVIGIRRIVQCEVEDAREEEPEGSGASGWPECASKSSHSSDRERFIG